MKQHKTHFFYRTLLLCCILLLTLALLPCYAQSGSNDSTFNFVDTGFGSKEGAFGGAVLTTARQNDGKILIGGSFSNYSGTVRNHIARLNADGSLDFSFNPGTATDGNISKIALQADGKILISGFFTRYNGIARNSIARLNVDGSLDSAFNPILPTNGPINEIAVLANGKIIIAGRFNGLSGSDIQRLNADGSVDTSFFSGIGTNGAINAIVLQSDGKIIIGGDFITYNGVSRNHIARLNPNGDLDFSFDAGAGPNNTIHAIALQNDGKILIGGSFLKIKNTLINSLARLESSGELDPTFRADIVAFGPVRTITVLPSSMIIVGGDSRIENLRFRLFRLFSNGALDNSFGRIGANNTVHTSLALPDGKIVIGGNFTAYDNTFRNHIALLNTDGSVDLRFSPITGANSIVNTSVIQPDGKILIGGVFTAFNGSKTAFNANSRNGLARLNSDGALDTTFTVDPAVGLTASTEIRAIALQLDGKIIIGGKFISSFSVNISRLNINGSVDFSFNPAINFTEVNAIVVQGDGKILIAGASRNSNGTQVCSIVRLHSNGSIDSSFIPPTDGFFSDPLNTITAIAIQNDGKILATKPFNPLFLIGDPLIRLLPNGTLDNTFSSVVTYGDIKALTPQGDGKILVGGSSLNVSGGGTNTTVALLRMNGDGTLDTNFNPQIAHDTISAITLQADGKILLGGSFRSANIARLNSDGALDSTFAPGIGVKGGVLFSAINTISLQKDGKAVIAGDFTSYNGVGRNNVARIFTTSGLLPNVFVTSPADNAKGVPLTVTVVSKALSGAATYTIQLSPKQDFSFGVLEKSGTRSQQFTGLNYSTRYYCRVKTNLAADFGVITSFTTVLPEDLAFVTNPKNSAVDQNINVKFSVSNVPGATLYTVQLDTVPSFTAPLGVSLNGTLTFTMPGLQYNTTYYSRVKTDLTENWGAIRSFTTIDASKLSLVVSPANGAIGVSPTLKVTSAEVLGATQYTIELNTSPTFTDTAFIAVGSTRVLSFSGLRYNTTYYNRVKTELSNSWGATRSFTTGTPESFSFMVSPANGATNVNTVVNITAGEVPGATQYSIEANTLPDFTGISIVKTGTVRSYSFQLLPGQQYFVRVQTNLAPGRWGVTRSFTTAGAPAVLATGTVESNGELILSSANNAKVFPNPFVTNTQLMVPSDNRESLQLIITDLMGNEVIRMNGYSNELITFGESLKPGNYVLKFTTGGNLTTIHMIKQ